ncbi:Hypothetical_protein [Hexamita inflata]|uniref:Hypothetical_protein n=1 Tax=Hexamita inflata TaxID=28002 RepID=A0AA86UR60_9EUKA|nr:Hypothetical protein HINF_LOCUS48991 [Hexamita inflata]
MKRVGTSGFPACKYNTTKKSARQRAFNSAKQLLKLAEFVYFETVYSCFQQRVFTRTIKQILSAFAVLRRTPQKLSRQILRGPQELRPSLPCIKGRAALSQILAPLAKAQAGSNGRAAVEAENTQTAA